MDSAYYNKESLACAALALLHDPDVFLTSEDQETVQRFVDLCSRVLKSEAPAPASRADIVFRKFLRLLAEHHTRERSVGFYAGKLLLSPKYLSKLVKVASGRSAPEWIDAYVILTAKDYLKHSDLSIKQIVYQLHFTDQPAFTKYFKSHTGMTPAQFRRS